jgi:phosphate-selective porin OprO and OprP
MKASALPTVCLFMKFSRLGFALAAAWIVTEAAGRAEPADRAELEALRAQVQKLEQELKLLSRQLEIKEAAAATAAPTAPKVTVTDKGVSFTSADGANTLKLHGLVQFDSRNYFGDHGATTNTFLIRRGRIFADGTFAKLYSFQVIPEFSGTPTLIDANLTATLSPALQLRFGRFKPPTGLERLQSDSLTFFDERALPSNLTPDRDIGVQAFGDVLGGKVSYAAGVFNGVPDAGTSSNADFDNDKELAARIYTAPFKKDTTSPLQGLSFGIAATEGRSKTASGRTAGYKTDGQQTFFSYNSAVVGDGRSWRVIPQLDYRTGPFGVLTEYVVSAVDVRPSAGASKSELRNRAWQVSAGWVLTGEDSSYTGVVPLTNFDWSAGTWGAFEVAARYGELDIDDAAFPTFASAANSADAAKSIGLGLNWYLTKIVRFTLDYYQTRFELSPLAPAVPANALLRQDEKALISRFQLSF